MICNHQIQQIKTQLNWFGNFFLNTLNFGNATRMETSGNHDYVELGAKLHCCTVLQLFGFALCECNIFRLQTLRSDGSATFGLFVQVFGKDFSF